MCFVLAFYNLVKFNRITDQASYSWSASLVLPILEEENRKAVVVASFHGHLTDHSCSLPPQDLRSHLHLQYIRSPHPSEVEQAHFAVHFSCPSAETSSRALEVVGLRCQRMKALAEGLRLVPFCAFEAPSFVLQDS